MGTGLHPRWIRVRDVCKAELHHRLPILLFLLGCSLILNGTMVLLWPPAHFPDDLFTCAAGYDKMNVKIDMDRRIGMVECVPRWTTVVMQGTPHERTLTTPVFNEKVDPPSSIVDDGMAHHYTMKHAVNGNTLTASTFTSSGGSISIYFNGESITLKTPAKKAAPPEASWSSGENSFMLCTTESGTIDTVYEQKAAPPPFTDTTLTGKAIPVPLSFPAPSADEQQHTVCNSTTSCYWRSFFAPARWVGAGVEVLVELVTTGRFVLTVFIDAFCICITDFIDYLYTILSYIWREFRAAPIVLQFIFASDIIVIVFSASVALTTTLVVHIRDELERRGIIDII